MTRIPLHYLAEAQVLKSVLDNENVIYTRSIGKSLVVFDIPNKGPEDIRDLLARWINCLSSARGVVEGRS